MTGRVTRKKVGLPRLTQAERQEVYDAFEKYIAEREDPRLAGFLANDPVPMKYWVNRANMQDWPEMQRLLERSHAKQEDYLNQKGMNGQATAMAIFRLKQPWHGYRDRFEQDVTSKGEKVTFINTVPRPRPERERKGYKQLERDK